MAEPVTRRAFLLAAAFVVLPTHHRPWHTRGPAPSPTPEPEPTVGLYGDAYSPDY